MEMLKIIARDFRRLFFEGITVRGKHFCVAVVAGKGDLKWFCKIALERSFQNSRRCQRHSLLSWVPGGRARIDVGRSESAAFLGRIPLLAAAVDDFASDVPNPILQASAGEDVQARSFPLL